MTCLRSLIPAVFLFWLATAVIAQTPDGYWNTRLVGRPFYLRGGWRSDQLKFDGTGALLVKSDVVPFTLAGVEVKRATLSGDFLVLEGLRVALVQRSDGRGGLERQPLSSTTHLDFSLRRGDKKNFHAQEEMRIVIEPDSTGNFDTALSKVFADGLVELAATVPLYWKCYADSYFLPATISADALEKVKACVDMPLEPKAHEASDAAGASHVPVMPPVLTFSGPMMFQGIARDLHFQGDAVIHLRVTTEGRPVGLQVVKALGAGLDETALQAVSEYRFKPAMRGGVAIPCDLNVNVQHT